MSTYDDYDPRDRRRRDDRPAPYPEDYARDDRRAARRADPPTTAPPPVSGSQAGKSAEIPPPPLGSAMKREGSRSRVPPGVKPEFPDEASYLNARGPDLERKNDERDRKFRERRDGYNSDEAEAMRGDPRRTRSRRDPAGRPRYDDGDRRPAASEVSGMPIRERRDRGAKSEGEEEYDRRRPPPRDYDDRRRDDRPRRRDPDPYYDDEPRRRPRRDVEYGAEPIKSSKREDDAFRADRDKRPRRNDDYDDYDRPSRRKSLPPRRSDKYDDDDDYYDKGGRDRRRRDTYDDRDYRRPARRRSYDDDDDYYRRRDDRDRRDRRDGDKRDDKDKKEPTHMKIGNKDFGPAIDKGQKYYQSLAPILGPIVMTYLKKH